MNRALLRTGMAGFVTTMAGRMFVPDDAAIGVGIVAAGAMWRYGGRLRTEASIAEDRDLARELPIALDVLSLALDAGASWDRATLHAAACCTGSREADLRTAAARLAMGAAPSEVWRGSRVLEVLGALVERSFRTGAGVSRVLRQHADAVRQSERSRRIEAARRLATRAVMPVTFLGYPAFLLLGLIPTLVTSMTALIGPLMSTTFEGS